MNDGGWSPRHQLAHGRRFPRQSCQLACFLALAVGLGAAIPGVRAAPLLPRRVAVLVGANAPALGRQPLRYAHRDAEQLARVLVQVGGFAPADVHVLNDPPPEAVLAQLRDAGAKLHETGSAESLLFFYYSGHADGEAIYPGGQALPLGHLRTLLSDAQVTVRVGLIDACRGGGWTRTKGLTATDTFELPPLAELSSAGSVLISSSSGFENAHESEKLRGSFFSHHFMAGLLGAADQTGDGEVSLNEAFEYAKQLTIRDTARAASAPQHPSFEVQLRGRRDLVLSRLRTSLTTVRLEQERGPLEIVALQSGQVLAETQPGRRAVTLALPPGHYLARRPLRTLYSADEFDVTAGSTVIVRERDLQPVAAAGRGVRAKGGYTPRLPLDATTVERGIIEIHAAVGLQSHPSLLPMNQSLFTDIGIAAAGARLDASQQLLTGYLTAHLGITSRLQWMIGTGSFAYRLGQRGRPEAVVWGGLLGWGVGYNREDGVTFRYRLGLGVDVRLPLGDWQSVLLSVGAYSTGIAAAETSLPPTTWRVTTDLGYRMTVSRKVTANLGLGVELNALYDGQAPPPELHAPELDVAVRVGSVQALGTRALPLVQVHLSRWLSLDAYFGLEVNLRTSQARYSFLLGTTMLMF